MGKKYNPNTVKWVTVSDSKDKTGRKSRVSTTTGSKATNASTGSALPRKATPMNINSISSGGGGGNKGKDSGKGKDSRSGRGKDSTADKKYDEVAYDIVEGTLKVTKADMGLKCREGVNLSGIGSVYSTIWYISEVTISLNATSMSQTLKLHRDSIGAKVKTVAQENRAEEVKKKETPKKTYTVVRGDCLYRIAQKQLGNASRWKEIYSLNKGVIGSNPNLIYPGQVYTLPD